MIRFRLAGFDEAGRIAREAMFSALADAQHMHEHFRQFCDMVTLTDMETGEVLWKD